MTGKTITIEEAQLKTFSVSARAITINKRQMTLAVFRQLFEEGLYDRETLERRGEPWGIVNYHWKDGCPSGEHHHVVWQNGNELRRCGFTQRRSLLKWEFEARNVYRGLWLLHRTDAEHVRDMKPELKHELSVLFYGEWGTLVGNNIYGPPVKTADVLTSLEQEHGDVRFAKKRYDETVRRDELWAVEWGKICELDQLFIAV